MAIVELRTWELRCDGCRSALVAHRVGYPSYPKTWVPHVIRNEYATETLWLCAECAAKAHNVSDGKPRTGATDGS